MKRYIKITNAGEIDLNAFFLLGASTKRNEDNKIGFFGSGLKYGLAVLLRNKIKVKIFSGIKEIIVTTKKKKFREETFNQIFINNKPTGLTIEMGIDWKPWFAIREIYSNALDEPSCTMGIAEEENVIPDFDKTIFYIEITEEIESCLQNWDEYFSQKRKDLVFYNDDLKVFHGSDYNILYRKGIQCHKSNTKSLYHYDLKSIAINESRTLKCSLDTTWRVCEVVKRNANKEIIRKIYDNQDDSYIENRFRWSEGSFNEDWLNVIGGRRLVVSEVAGHYHKEIAEGNVLILNKSLVKALSAQFKNNITVVGQSDNFGEHHIIETSKKHSSYIDEAIKFLYSNGYEIIYAVKIAVFENKDILGQALGDTILLSDRVFEEGKKKVCEAILEEYLHIKYKYNDCSREMQTLLFTKLISMMEEKQEVYF